MMHQIPQVHQPGPSAVAVKPGMQIGNIKMDERRCQQIIHGRFLMDELHQLSHILRQHLTGNTGMLHLVPHDIDAVVAVFMAGQELILLR